MLLIHQIYGFTQETIPKTEAPPHRSTLSAAVYDDTTNSIITIGGDYYQSTLRTPLINSFSLVSHKFQKINSFSDIEPKGLAGHGLYLKANRKIYEFGYSAEFYSFNLEDLAWKLEELNGDQLDERGGFGFTTYEFNSTKYVALFGGLLDSGYSNDLFLIDMDTFESQKIKGGSSTPLASIGMTLVYYDESLYTFGYAPLKEIPHSNLLRFDLWTREWEVVDVIGQVPEPRIQHYGCIYNEEMYIIYGLLYETLFEYDSIFKFNFKTKTWTKVSDEYGTRISVAGYVLVGSKLYLFYGRNLQTVLNSVVSLDLSYNPPKREIISPDFATPESRIYHSSVVISTYMYTFGGTNGNQDDTETLYNDLWQFDLVNQVWNYVNTVGANPEKRYDFGCTVTIGDVFAIFGGVGENSLLSDFYYYHETFKTWYQIIGDGISPSPRKGSCLTYYNYTYFIIGGQNTEKGFDEVWTYSIETNKFLLMEKTIFNGKDDINDAKCWVEENDGNIEITLIGGCNFLAIPNFLTIRMNYFYHNTSIYLKPINLTQQDTLPLVIGAGSSIIKSKDLIFGIGGLLYDYIMIIPPRIKNLTSSAYIPYEMSKNINLYGSTGVHYENSFYIFGGGGASESFRSTYQITSNIYKISFNSSDQFSLSCSPGHLKNNLKKPCKPCPKGTYFDNDTCKLCPKGRFSQVIAATSIEQCLPCPAGSFNDKEGGFQCFDCPSGFTCPMGSNQPKFNFELPKNESIQPKAYKSSKSFITYIVENLWFSVSATGAFLIVICISFTAIWNKIERFDMFVAQHSNQLGQPVIHRKTKIGGLFSIFFVGASVITIISGFLAFQMDNINENKALIPLITLEESVKAKSVSIISMFYIYGGNCTVGTSCHPNILFEDSGFSYSDRSIECFMIDENCVIRSLYKDFKMTQKTSEVLIKLKEKSSFSSAISVNMSSSSSIPNDISSIFSSFSTGSAETLFRGTTPSKIYFKLTPSLFTSESSQWPSKEAGYHISNFQEPEKGSISTKYTVNIQINLLVSLILYESDTAMRTIRTINQSAFVFLGALLGSIFGLMGTFSSVMGYAEELFEKAEKRRLEHQKVRETEKKIRIIKSQFGKWNVINHSRKVIPIDTSHSSIAYTNH